jgi:hypothetical protein
MIKKVYNLEFPLHVNNFLINKYKFYKVEGYEDRRQGLQQLVNVTDDQVIIQNTGSHQHTAYVDIPEQEEESIIHQDLTDGTKLNDILLFISLFTRRDVFALSPEVDHPIIADPRKYAYGGGLVCSLPYKAQFYDEITGKRLSQEELESEETLWEERDYTLIEGIEGLLDLINTREWQDIYEDGYFLRLYKSAIKFVDPYIPWDVLNYIQCWTIWENIFALRHKEKLSDIEIMHTKAKKKIDFVLTEYFNISTTIPSKQVVDKLVKARNRVLHFGKNPSNLTGKEVVTFIRATEALVAMTLKLEPSNVLNYKEKLDSLLFQAEDI